MKKIKKIKYLSLRTSAISGTSPSALSSINHRGYNEMPHMMISSRFSLKKNVGFCIIVSLFYFIISIIKSLKDLYRVKYFNIINL